MHKPTLHELVHAYHSGAASKTQILERIAELVYRDPRRFGFDDEDDAAEALYRHGRRIASLADRFEDRGLAFDAYLVSSLRFLARTMRRERRRAAEKEFVCEQASACPSCDQSDPFEKVSLGWWEEEKSPVPPRSPRAARRALPHAEEVAFNSRLVFLALKCAWDIDDELLAHVARASGVEIEWLRAALTQARRSLESERCRYERMAARRNGSWCRLRFLEARLGAEADEGRRRSLLEAIGREKENFERARTEMAAFKPVVPNSVVARILGVPKGTVDSGLYYLKRRARAASQARDRAETEEEARVGRK